MKKVRPIKERIIFFEGIDKSGKTYLKTRMYNERHLFQYWIEDRGFISRHVYHSFRQEPPQKIANWLNAEEILLKNNLCAVVYFNIPAETSIDRHLKISEYPEFSLEEFNIQKKIYQDVLNHYNIYWKIPILEIDSVKYNPDQCINIILDWIENNEEAKNGTYSKTN